MGMGGAASPPGTAGPPGKRRLQRQGPPLLPPAGQRNRQPVIHGHGRQGGAQQGRQHGRHHRQLAAAVRCLRPGPVHRWGGGGGGLRPGGRALRPGPAHIWGVRCRPPAGCSTVPVDALLRVLVLCCPRCRAGPAWECLIEESGWGGTAALMKQVRPWANPGSHEGALLPPTGRTGGCKAWRPCLLPLACCLPLFRRGSHAWGGRD
jgi:hypothetical protein